MDGVGAGSLVLFAALLGLNQVAIKVGNGGLQPIFFAGLRSLGAVLCIALWMRWRGIPIRIERGTVPGGLAISACFTVEFVLLFVALDLTTVTRTSVIFYSMPLWLAAAGHFVLDEAVTRQKALGLALAFAGVAWAILMRPPGGEGSIVGDLCALGAAMAWAGIALCARATSIARVRPEQQLLWQLGVSGLVLTALAPLAGPLLRDPGWSHWAALGFQIVVIAAAAFLFWMWLLTRYRADAVASFSFLSPIFGALFGWALLDERLGVGLLGALGLVSAGLVLVNWPERRLRSRRTSP